MATPHIDSTHSYAFVESATTTTPAVDKLDTDALISALAHSDAATRDRAARELSRRIEPPPGSVDSEALLQRVALEDLEAAISLLALIDAAPWAAWPIHRYLDAVLEDRDELLLRLGDAAVCTSRTAPK